MSQMAAASVPPQGPQATQAVPAAAGAPAVTVSAPLIVDVNEQTVQDTLALSRTVPVVIVFYTQQSLASKQALNTLEALARADAGAFQLAKVDVETSPSVAQAFQIQTVPTAFALVGGRPVPLFEGEPTETQAREVMGEILQVAPQMGVTGRIQVNEDDLERPTPPEHMPARTAEDEGDWDRAVKAWKKVLANNPADKEAKVALARARFERRLEREQEEDGGSPDTPAELADSMFARGDEEGAFNVLLDALVASFDPKEKEKLRKQLVGLFPIAADPAAVKSARSRLATHLMV